MCNFVLDYLCYRGSNQVMILIDCNRIKGSFVEVFNNIANEIESELMHPHGG